MKVKGNPKWDRIILFLKHLYHETTFQLLLKSLFKIDFYSGNYQKDNKVSFSLIPNSKPNQMIKKPWIGVGTFKLKLGKISERLARGQTQKWGMVEWKSYVTVKNLSAFFYRMDRLLRRKH